MKTVREMSQASGDEYTRPAILRSHRPAAPRPGVRLRKRTRPGRMRSGRRQLWSLFVGFGGLRGQEPAGAAARAQVKALQGFITANYYPCTRDILRGPG